jgi:hypothetical protein
MDSGQVLYGPELYVPFATFREACSVYARPAGYEGVRWNKDVYLGLFQERGLELTDNAEKKFPRLDVAGKKKRTIWVVGCELRSDE